MDADGKGQLSGRGLCQRGAVLILRRSTEGVDRGENGKIYGKGMNAARQISRRLDRTAGAWARAAADCLITSILLVASMLLNELNR